jgi:hypothetical protein
VDGGVDAGGCGVGCARIAPDVPLDPVAHPTLPAAVEQGVLPTHCCRSQCCVCGSRRRPFCVDGSRLHRRRLRALRNWSMPCAVAELRCVLDSRRRRRPCSLCVGRSRCPLPTGNAHITRLQATRRELAWNVVAACGAHRVEGAGHTPAIDQLDATLGTNGALDPCGRFTIDTRMRPLLEEPHHALGIDLPDSRHETQTGRCLGS